jgi:site-specific recombinase XerC
MSTKIHERVAPGIYRLASGGFRVKVAVGDRRRGGRQRETTFPADAGLREMKKWQTHERAKLLRQGIVPARGMLEADVPTYLSKMKRKLAFADSREDEINAWLVRFGNRKRHTITREEVRRQIKDWEDEGFAASTIRHRMTALSTLYDVLDGDDAYNPIKGIKRPTEAEPKPDSHPPHIIIGVLDELWLRAAMNNRGWKTLARALVLAHTGMRPSQMMRLDPDLHIRSYLDDAVAMVEVPSGKGGRTHWKPLTTDGVAAFRLFLRVGAQARSRHRRSTSHGCWRATAQASRASIRTSCATPTRRSFGALERTSRTFRNCSGTSHRRRRSGTRWWYLRSSSP